MSRSATKRLESVALESTETIDIDEFVPRDDRNKRRRCRPMWS
jgi:non-homologous end joining protein Ku